MKAKEISALYIRNFIFGVEDSLVSTVGLLSGIAVAGVPKATIFLTGVVLVFVEAFSMGVGSFLSEQSAEEYIDKKTKLIGKSFKGGLIMFFSYFAAGFIPLFPYIILGTTGAFGLSITLSLISLFVLGIISARLLGTKLVKGAIRMLALGGIAIIAGVVVGKLVNAL